MIRTTCGLLLGSAAGGPAGFLTRPARGYFMVESMKQLTAPTQAAVAQEIFAAIP